MILHVEVAIAPASTPYQRTEIHVLVSKGVKVLTMFILDEITKSTDEHLEAFAKDGLRTLCIAKKVKYLFCILG